MRRAGAKALNLHRAWHCFNGKNDDSCACHGAVLLCALAGARAGQMNNLRCASEIKSRLRMLPRTDRFG